VIVESRQQSADIGGRRVVLETNHDITEIRRSELNARFIIQLDLALAQITDPDEIVRLATGKLGEFLGTSRCHLGEIDREAGLSIVRKSWEGSLDAKPSLARGYRISEFIPPQVRAVLEEGKAVIIDDVKIDPRTRDSASKYTALGVGAAISVPIFTGGQWEATLTATQLQPRTWRPDEEQLMRETALRVWVAVKQGRVVAALHESEARARRALAEQMVAGFAESDATGKFTMVNQRYCDITGRTRNELLNMRVRDITHPDDWPQNAELYRRLFEVGDSFFFEKRYRRKNGSEVWINSHVSPIRNTQGEIVESVAVIIDVTDINLAEDELRSAYDLSD
jgi:PAS domain S-box-containing protein